MKLNPTSASLLGLLQDCDEMTGGDLLRTAQLRIGEFWTLTRSQVYRELNALADAGFIEQGESGPRDSQPYRLTRQGRSAFRQWLAHATPANQVRIGLLVLVAFGRDLPPGRLRELLDEAETEHRERLAGYEVLDEALAADAADPYVRATLAFGLHYERSVLQWLEGLPEGVRNGTIR